MIIDSSIRARIIDLFDISLEDYKAPVTTKYELLSPDNDITSFRSSYSKKFFIIYREDFIVPHKIVVERVENWWGSKIIKTYKAKKEFRVSKGPIIDHYTAQASGDCLVLFEVNPPIKSE